jgi:hypothetical protein
MARQGTMVPCTRLAFTDNTSVCPVSRSQVGVGVPEGLIPEVDDPDQGEFPADELSRLVTACWLVWPLRGLA